jgi:hypothetical protein
MNRSTATCDARGVRTAAFGLVSLVTLLVALPASAQEQVPNLELGLHTGVALPQCGDDCAGAVHDGALLGAFALIRPARWGALGIAADVVRFPWQAKDADFSDGSARVDTSFVGLAGRWYALDAQPFDAFLAASAGVLIIDAKPSSVVCDKPAGPALELGGGFETGLGAGLRLTTSAATLLGKPKQSCEDLRIAGDAPAPPLVEPALMLRIGLTFGIRAASEDSELE